MIIKSLRRLTITCILNLAVGGKTCVREIHVLSLNTRESSISAKMAKIGHVAEFNIDTDDWEIYVERVKLFFTANGVKSDLKTAVFLTIMGHQAYKKMRTLCSPDAPDTKSFDELCKIMTNQGGKPKPTEIAARFAFNNRKQQPQESVSEYHLALKELAEDCNFVGDLETRLRDQLVVGLKCKATQEEMLTDSKLTYNSALSKALSRECASKDAKSLNDSTREAPVNKMFSQNKSANKKCQHCGKLNHESSKYYFKNSVCNNCHKRGHIKPVCPAKSKSTKGPKKHVHRLEADDDDDDDDPETIVVMKPMKVVKILRNDVNIVPPYMVTVKIDGSPFQMEIDTGAAVSVICKNYFTRLSIKRPLQKSDVTLGTYSKHTIVPIGKCNITVSYGNSETTATLYVVENDCAPLLGRPWLEKIKLNLPEIKQIAKSANDQCPAKSIHITDQYPTLFSDTLGKMKDI